MDKDFEQRYQKQKEAVSKVRTDFLSPSTGSGQASQPVN